MYTKNLKMNINIFTLNILSSMTITHEYYPQTETRYLDPVYRINLLKELLNKYIDLGYIFCLQEISTKDWKMLKLFFEKNNYNFLHQTISTGSSRLGLSICFPKTYELFYSNIIKVSDKIKFSFENNEDLKKYLNDKDIVDAILTKQQIMVVGLKDGLKKFYVSTYHMPCRFLQQKLMETHALFCMKIINEIVDNSPIIFAGDFNSKYGEDVYKILTSNNCTSKLYCDISKNYICCKNYFADTLDNQNHNHNHNLNHNQRLPTCYDQKDSKSYIIDFIFYRNLNIISSKLLEHDFPIPNEKYPSDHLPIIASFSLIDV